MKKNTQLVIHLIIVWMCLTSTAPFIFYLWPFHPYKLLTFACLAVMSLLMIRRKNVYLSKKLVIVFLIQIIYFLVISVIFSVYKNINICVQLIACLIIIAYIESYIGFNVFARSYIYIIIFMGIGGCITYFAHVLIGINPIFEVQYSEIGYGSKTYFLGLTSTNVYVNRNGIRFIRFSGFFDEPGAFALYAIFALLINKTIFNNKRYEIILIVTTLFAFSLAFYVFLFIYIILFYFRLVNIKYFIIPVLLLTIILIQLNRYSSDNQIINNINNFTLKRFTATDEKSILSGGSRSTKQKNDRLIFLDNPYWGIPDKSKVNGSNVFSTLAGHGILGSMFYYLLLLYFVYLILKKSITFKDASIYLKVFFLIIINFYHRPGFMDSFIVISVYVIISKLEQISFRNM